LVPLYTLKERAGDMGACPVGEKSSGVRAREGFFVGERRFWAFRVTDVKNKHMGGGGKKST